MTLITALLAATVGFFFGFLTAALAAAASRADEHLEYAAANYFRNRDQNATYVLEPRHEMTDEELQIVTAFAEQELGGRVIILDAYRIDEEQE